jgi:putative peptide zinc metalloprotease protein
VGLIWLVSGHFFFVGVLLGIWGAVGLLMLPAVREVLRLLGNPAVQNRRTRLMALAGGAAVAVALMLCVFPMPFWTTTQGIIRLPEQSVVRAGTDCQILEVLAPVEEMVEKDAPLLKGADPFLETQIKIYRARLQEQYANYNAQPLHERVKRKMLLEEIQRIKGDLRQAEERLGKLLVRSPARGKFILIEQCKTPGRFFRKGELLGYIVADHRPTIRAVVDQDDIGLIRQQITGVKVRLTELMETPLNATIERIVPEADLNLPSAALGTAGGGVIPVDPGDPDGLRATKSLFQLDLSLPQEVKDPHIGSRVYVRFEHGRMPLAFQWFRTVRQLFLGRFYV